MHSFFFRHRAHLQVVAAVALTLVTGIQARAEIALPKPVIGLTRFTNSADLISQTTIRIEPVLFGNSDGGVVAEVQDSAHHGDHGKKPDTTGRAKRDSLEHAKRDSLHKRDSINHGKRDSLEHAKRDSLHKRDTIEHGKRDSTNHAKRDSTERGKRDSTDHAKRDSTDHGKRDSTEHGKRDSTNHGKRDSIEHHRRDSINRKHRDSVIVIGHDSLHTRDSIRHFNRDSLIKVWRDSLHKRDSIRHGSRDTTKHRNFSEIRNAGDVTNTITLAVAQDAPVLRDDGTATAALTKQGISGIPGTVALMQNYPNPFGGSAGASTAIDFTLPTAQSVTMTVFNSSGQQVSILLSGMQSAGAHHVEFTSSNLSPGIYFYMLATEQGTMTKRMIKVH